jgi:hypothetical protein
MADQNPPQIISVANLGLISVEILFDETVEKASAESVQNYMIENNITIFSVSLQQDLKTVRLITSEHVIEAPYTLYVNNVRDRATVPNTILPNTSYSYVATGGLIDVAITADDGYEIYINGIFMGNGSDWRLAKTYSAPSIAGKNIIAVKCFDIDGVGGLVAEIDFNGSHFVTNDDWKVVKSEESGWETVAHNDIAWQKATSYGLHGIASPWADYQNVVGISTTSNVHWIWSSDAENDNTVYFRFTLRVGGDTTPPSPPTGVTVTSR